MSFLRVRPGGTIGYEFWEQSGTLVQRFTSDALPGILGQSSSICIVPAGRIAF
jgi:hypothetical protein